MPANVHGHVILEHIIEAGGQIPLAELQAFATGHGNDATYYTCSASDMSFEALLKFLSLRGKLRLDGENVTVFPENMCNHGEHDHH